MIKTDRLIHKYEIWDNQEAKGEITVLDGISLDIPSGQFIAVLGPNGCGKSTFAKHLNVLLLPDEGTVWIDGKDTSNREFLQDIRTQVGMVFQNPDNQIVGTSVEEDVAFGPENKNIESDKIQSLVQECLEKVGLIHKRKASPHRLSGGEKQRVAIASALASMPECIVLDEPTAMLDPGSRQEVIDVIHKLNRSTGVTIVLITHHTDEVLQADRIIVMAEGKIKAQGTPEEIFGNRELIRSSRLDVPQIVELGDKLKSRGLGIKTPVLSTEQLFDELQRLQERERR